MSTIRHFVCCCACVVSAGWSSRLTRLESSADDSIRHHHPCFTYDVICCCFFYLISLVFFFFLSVWYSNEFAKNNKIDSIFSSRFTIVIALFCKLEVDYIIILFSKLFFCFSFFFGNRNTF